MTDRPLDAERVAALLDGRLSAQERAQVLAQLAKDPAWREVAADVGAVLGEDDADGAMPAAKDPVLPPASPAGGRVRVLPWLGLAAAASIGVFAIVRSPEPAEQGSAVFSPARATTLALTPEALGELMTDRWSTVRAGTEVLTPLARAVRLGALSVDLFLERETGGLDVRAEMRELLAAVDGAAAVSRLLGAARDSAQLDVALASIRALVRPDAYDAGVWLELRRAGASRGERDQDALELLRRVVDGVPGTAEEKAELARRRLALEEALVRRDEEATREAAAGVLRLLGS